MCRRYKKVSGNVGRQQPNQRQQKRRYTGCRETKAHCKTSL